MKTCPTPKLCLRLQRLFILGFCLAAASLLASGAVIQPLHSFGQKGTTPMLTLARDGGMYGTIPTGGAYGFGAVYRLTPDGQYSFVYSFTGQEDGSNPGTTLMQASDGNFYGTTVAERPAQVGTVFRISTNGALTTLFKFTGGNDGRNSAAGLVEGNDHYLYGTTPGGGASAKGTIFRISMDGDFTTLYSFSGGDDGSTPLSGLVLAGDGSFFGLASAGGAYSLGTVFRITTNGTFTTLYPFTGGDDGGGPSGLLLAADGNLYGTTIAHGSGQDGTVFQLTTNGTLTTLYAFTHQGDGAAPARLIQATDGNLYGITGTDGVFGFGTIFRISTSGTLVTIYLFHGGNEGAYPNGVLQSGNGFLYGTTQSGGAGGVGIAFRLSVDGTLTPLHAFEGGNGSGMPHASLLQATDGLLYGTTYGGAYDFGTVFRITTTGLFSSLYQFRGWTDGGYPTAGLIQASDGLFYGTTYYSANTTGTVYQLNPNAGLTTLYSFSGGAEGNYPQGRLLQTGGNLYGTTAGGFGSSGSVFRMTTNGSLTTLHTFNGTNDGASPIAGLTLASDGALYGTTQSGGASNYGTVFRITTDGSFETVYSFSGGDDGGRPTGALIQTGDGNLYGTTYGVGFGTVFQLSTNGVLTTLHSFTGAIDGANPWAGLIQGADGYLYGTTTYGGLDSGGQPFAGNGTVFRMTATGEFTTLHRFIGGNDGGNPSAELMLTSDGSLYGTTASGGALGLGTVFRLSPGLSNSPPVVQLAQTQYRNYEHSLGQSVLVQRLGQTATTVSVDYRTIDGTALAGFDYVARQGTLVFRPGETNKRIQIPIIDDRIAEPDETLGLLLTNVSVGALLGTNSSALLTIVDDDHAGMLDPTFDAGADICQGIFSGVLSINSLALQEDGRLLAGGNIQNLYGQNRWGLIQFLPNGAVDSGFTAPPGPGLTTIVQKIGLQSDGKAVRAIRSDYTPDTCDRLFANGLPDSSFAPVQLNPAVGLGGGAGRLETLLVQSDDKIVIAGAFTTVNGLERYNIARLNPNGTLDSSFIPPPKSSPYIYPESVTCVASAPAGKILLGGKFIVTNNVTCSGLVRLNSDGSFDSSFDPGSGLADQSGIWVPWEDALSYAIAVQSDGCVLVGGTFMYVNGISRTNLARLNPDGSLDTNFNTAISWGGMPSLARVWTIVLQPDNKILIGGRFDTVNDQLRVGIARLLPDGSLDQEFSSGDLPYSMPKVRSIVLEPQGGILVGGDFYGFGGFSRCGIARLYGTSSPTPYNGHPWFTSLVRENGGATTLYFIAQPGQTCTVETTADFTGWFDSGAATEIGNGYFKFEDAPTSAPWRFYRVVSP